jgi:hypothetical protein
MLEYRSCEIGQQATHEIRDRPQCYFLSPLAQYCESLPEGYDLRLRTLDLLYATSYTRQAIDEFASRINATSRQLMALTPCTSNRPDWRHLAV